MKHFIFLLGMILVGFTTAGQQNNQYFKRVDEPREKALSFLIPQGWQVEGGAIRIMDPAIAGASNMVECKFDLAVKKDNLGSVMIRWLPEMLCIDQSMAWGNPEGAVFNNTLVRRKRSPDVFMMEVAVPYAHPNATGVKMVSYKNLPGLISRYLTAMDPTVRTFMNMSYQAGLAEYTYSENGITFRERMVCVIEDYGTQGGGLWKNRETMLIRAPDGKLNDWEPVLNVIQSSGKWSVNWVVGEINGQRKRAGQIAVTQQEIQKIDNEISRNRTNVYSEINKEMYLTLTEQNKYRNPFTGETEIDTDNWKNRWIDNSGNIIFSDDPAYNPNLDPNLNVSGYKLSEKGK